MNIKIGTQYRLTSDSCNIILSRKTQQKDKTKPPAWGRDTFYRTIEQALNAVMELEVYKSDATTIKELQGDVARCVKMIELIAKEIE